MRALSEAELRLVTGAVDIETDQYDPANVLISPSTPGNGIAYVGAADDFSYSSWTNPANWAESTQYSAEFYSGYWGSGYTEIYYWVDSERYVYYYNQY